MEWQQFDSYGCDSDNLGKNASLYFDQLKSWQPVETKTVEGKNLAANRDVGNKMVSCQRKM